MTTAEQRFLQDTIEQQIDRIADLEDENALLWGLLVRPACGKWLACTTATMFFETEGEARAFVARMKGLDARVDDGRT